MTKSTLRTIPPGTLAMLLVGCFDRGESGSSSLMPTETFTPPPAAVNRAPTISVATTFEVLAG